MQVVQRGEGSPRVKTLADLRLVLARISVRHGLAAPEREAAFTLGASEVDDALGGGLNRAALHEIHAPWTDWPAAAGFGLALALRAAPGRPLLWARQDFLEGEAGRLNGMGLAEFGVDPAPLSLVRGRDAEAVLRAGVEAARCKSLGAALIEIFGAPRALDLTATLRLARAAEASGVTVFLLRIRAPEQAEAKEQAKTGRPAPPSRAGGRARKTRALSSPMRRAARFFRHAAASSRRRGECG